MKLHHVNIPYRYEDPPQEWLDALEVLFPPRPKRPPPRTLADDLEDGMTDPAPPPEPLKMPEPIVLLQKRQREPDEEIPAFGKVTRVTIGDLNLMLSRFLPRLIEAFPDIGPQSWPSYLSAMTHDNQSFFRKTDNAVAFAVAARVACEQKVYVRLAFLFHRDAENEGLVLLREMRDWARHMGAKEILGLNRNCDIKPGMLRNRFNKTIETREEIVMVTA